MTKLKRKSAIIVTAIALFAAALLAFPGAKLWNTEWGGTVSALSTDGNGTYQISNSDELFEFVDIAKSQNSANAVLTNDIVVNKKVLENGELVSDTSSLKQWTPITEGYYGTFDGQGHTISGLYCDSDNTVSLFNNLENGAYIKNLGIIDSYFKSTSGAGAFCGSSNQGTIINCYSTGIIISTNPSSTATYPGGIAASNRHVSGSGRILNCWSTAKVSGEKSAGGICGYNNGTIFNCYSTQNPIAYGSGENVETKNKDAFKSGEVAYLLSENFKFPEECGSYTWGQYLGNNDYPVLKSFPVYKSCNGTSYTNSLEESVHKFTESFKDGSKKCTTCGTVEKTAITSVDGVYQIGTVGELYWFADKINNDNGSFQYAKAVLTKDITINEDVIVNGSLNSATSDFVSWTPISQTYRGTFDGQGHTISGLYCVSGGNVGLFTNLQFDACIQNIGIINSYFKGKSYVGAFCGASNYGTIKNCYSTGIVNSTNTSGGYVGGISAANLGNGRIINCYSNAKIEGGYKYTSGSICGNQNATLANCYGTDTDLEKFKSGEIAYLLSKGEDGSIWRQTIGKDDYPVLNSSHQKVLANEDETRFANNAIISGVSLTITDNFIISAYVKVSDDADEKYGLDNFSLNYKIEDKNISTDIPNTSILATRDGDVYRFTISGDNPKIAAKEMDKNITLKIAANGNDSLDEVTFTVNEYLNKLADTKPEYANLVKAAQNYGEAAKQYFTDGGTVADIDGITAADLENYGMTLSNSNLPSNVKYIGSTLLLNSEITLRHYFKISTNNVKFTVDGEQTSIAPLIGTGLDDIKYIEISNNINQLQSPHEMGCNGKTFITNSSVLSYAKSVLEDENADENLKNLVKAIYVYNQETLKFS